MMNPNPATINVNINMTISIEDTCNTTSPVPQETKPTYDNKCCIIMGIPERYINSLCSFCLNGDKRRLNNIREQVKFLENCIKNQNVPGNIKTQEQILSDMVRFISFHSTDESVTYINGPLYNITPESPKWISDDNRLSDMGIYYSSNEILNFISNNLLKGVNEVIIVVE